MNPELWRKGNRLKLLDTKTKQAVDLEGLTIGMEPVSGNAAEGDQNREWKIWLKLTGKSGKINITVRNELDKRNKKQA